VFRRWVTKSVTERRFPNEVDERVWTDQTVRLAPPGVP